MKKYELLDQLVIQNNGYLLTSDVVEIGISKTYLSEYVKSNNMERVAHGIYMSENAWPDNLYLLGLRNKRIIYSHETSMYLHGLTDREPSYVTVTIRAGYNASHLRRENIKVYTVNDGVINLGKTSVKTVFGNTVSTYDIDRSICDIIMHKKDIEVQMFNTIVNEYMRSREKSLQKLMLYAQALGVEAKIRTYTEVML